MQVCISLQIDNHASTLPLSFFAGRMPFLPPNQQRQSTKAVKVNRKTAPGKNEKKKKKVSDYKLGRRPRFAPRPYLSSQTLWRVESYAISRRRTMHVLSLF